MQELSKRIARLFQEAGQGGVAIKFRKAASELEIIGGEFTPASYNYSLGNNKTLGRKSTALQSSVVRWFYHGISGSS